MNVYSEADHSAVRLRLALEECAQLRSRLQTTITRTHALVDQYNWERQSIIPGSALAGLSEAKRKLVGMRDRERGEP